MALMTCRFYSRELGVNTSFTVILPSHETSLPEEGTEPALTDAKYQTLYLLHGLNDDDTAWHRQTSIERDVSPYRLAVVMPQVHQSFYADMKYGNRYWTFLTEELPRVARTYFPLSDRREDNFVAGLSMGGYGAFKWALNHPDRFGAAASLSGSLDMVNYIHERTADGRRPRYLELVYGTDDISGTDNDLIWLVRQANDSGEPLPKLFQYCGTEDALHGDNLKFQEACAGTRLDLTCRLSDPGTHGWQYWDERIKEVIHWLPLRTI